MPNWAKVIEAKVALARRGAKPSPQGANTRIPPGQKQVFDFPVLDLGEAPLVGVEEWRLRLFGLVQHEQSLDWNAFQSFPQVDLATDFHCVTRWSQLDIPWRGILARDLVAAAMPREGAQFVTLHAADRYTTNLPLEALLDDDVIVAHSVFGKPLPYEHGGPARLVVPKRYAWKSAKWLTAIEFHAEDRPGFWEVRGYHNEADPWKEQRFSSQESEPGGV
jgi:DMSO/TMAO reductase YedYZ molybdopterin-dependent catalytic subunit